MGMKLLSDMEIELEGVFFVIRPPEFTDFPKAMAWLKAQDIQDEETRDIMIGSVMNIYRIKRWDGIVLNGGNPAECTFENKMALFGQRPDLMTKLMDEIRKGQEEDEKNLSASQDG